MKFLADEGVDKPIVDILRSAGFNIHYILETHQGVEDERVLQIANEEERILITQDKDFGTLVYHLQNSHFGIILIRLGNRKASEKGQIVKKVILDEGERMRNAFTVIQPKMVRIRR